MENVEKQLIHDIQNCPQPSAQTKVPARHNKLKFNLFVFNVFPMFTTYNSSVIIAAVTSLTDFASGFPAEQFIFPSNKAECL